MNKISVAVAQMCSTNVPEENYTKAERYVAKAAEKGAKLIVFPENMNYMGSYVPEIRENIPDDLCCKRMSAAAKKWGMWVNIGSIKEKSEDAHRAYNTSVLFSPEGEIAAVYRKIHLCDMSSRPGSVFRESDNVLPGNEIVVTDTDFGRMGLAICYDMRFPELYRLLALQGAKIICQPSCFGMPTGTAHWEVMLRAIAIHNSCYVLAADQCGTRANGVLSWGNSMIIDPWGTVIAHAGQEREELLVAEIDLEYCDELKSRLGSLTNRREDVYTKKDRHLV